MAPTSSRGTVIQVLGFKKWVGSLPGTGCSPACSPACCYNSGDPLLGPGMLSLQTALPDFQPRAAAMAQLILKGQVARPA